jgi:hypothetical protein
MIKKHGYFINDFQSTEIKNITPESFYENDEKRIRIELYSSEDKFESFMYLKKPGWRSYQKFQLQRKNDFIYEFILPKELSSIGLLDYFITIVRDKEVLTFPGKLKVAPEFWAFNPKETFKISILPSCDRVIIYSPQRDIDNLTASNIWGYADYRIDYTFDNEFEEELNVAIRRVKDKFPELVLQIFVGEYTTDIQPNSTELELEIKSASKELDSIFVRVLYDNATGFESKILLSQNYEKVKIPLSQPKKFNFALLPRPYPTFLPYWFESNPVTGAAKNLKVESIQIAIPLPEPNKEMDNFGIKLKNIFLEKIK